MNQKLPDAALKTLIEDTKVFVQASLDGLEGSHDWWHISRVHALAVHLQAREGGNREVVELAALLHDIADYKHHGGDDTIGPERARSWLLSRGANLELANEVAQIISNMSFRGPASEERHLSLEQAIVQDADRLDAIGAIGVGRAFCFGGYFKRPLYDPAVLPQLSMGEHEYKHSRSSTLNHFFEKLLGLSKRMLTATGRQMAARRAEFTAKFVEQFLCELDNVEKAYCEKLKELMETVR